MASFENKFTDLGEFNTNVLEDDFNSDSLFLNKINGRTGKNGQFSYTHTTVLNDQVLSDTREFTFDFPLVSKYFLWYGFRNNGEIKFHLDLGNITLSKKDFNLFTNIKANADRTKFNFRVGGNYNGKNLTSGARLETECCDLNNVCFTTRNLYKHGNAFAGFVATLGLNDFQLCRKDAIVGFSNDQVDLYARHLAGDDCSPCSVNDCATEKAAHTNPLGRVVVDAVYQLNKKNSLAVQAEKNFLTNTHSVVAGHNSEVNDKLTLKNRLSDKLQWGFAIKYQPSDVLTFTTSGQIDFKSAKPFDTSKALPFPIGFQTEWNV